LNDPGIAKASDYLIHIEKKKSEIRQTLGKKLPKVEKGKTVEKVGKQLGVSGKTCLKLADMHVCPSVYVEKSN